MTKSLPKFIRSTYRKEPISSFFFLLGVTDAAIGGTGENWSLLAIGLTVAIVAMLARWLLVSKSDRLPPKQPARYYLPASSSRPPLPLLTKERNV
jgi:hypothetical protein